MGSPIAAGTLVVTKASVQFVVFVAGDRPLLGYCESATAPGAPGDPPTNVVVAWEDGTRTTYASTDGLLQFGASLGSSLLGTVMHYNNPAVPLRNPGGRLTGPVVLQGVLRKANGDPFVGNQDADCAVLKTPLGYITELTLAFAAAPSA